MATLNPDWVTEGRIDFEYKKYLLLGYLQTVSQYFKEDKLYPFLSDLVSQYRNLVSLRDNHTLALSQFPKQLSRLDLEEFTLEYERKVDDADYMEVIAQIVDYAIPRIQSQLGKGKEIYEQVESQMRIEPIGLVPIDTRVGYFFLHTDSRSDADIYEYEVSLFNHSDDSFRSLRTRFLVKVVLSITRTFESYKLDLIQTRRAWPNPAAWLVSASAPLPFQETLLPVAKRRLVRHLGSL